MTAPFLPESVRTAGTSAAPFGFYIAFQIEKPFIAVLQETGKFIFERSRRFPSSPAERTVERAAFPSLRTGGFEFLHFLAERFIFFMERVMILMACEISTFMEIPASLAFMAVEALFLFLFWLRLFDGKGNLSSFINGEDLDLHFIPDLQVIIDIAHIFISHFGNVNQTHFIVRQLYKCPELCDTCNSTFYDIADF